MSKFNQTNTMKTTNKSGHSAYAMHDKEKLVSQVLTSFWGEEKFYGDTTNALIKTANLVLEKDPQFVASLACYARKEMHLRSVSHGLTALIAHNVNSKPYIKGVVKEVVERADDITEILACYLQMYGKPIPNGLKKALGSALGKFSEYQISKYNGGNKAVKFKDVLKLTHTKPKDEDQSELFKNIINDTLPIAERWETELSAHGNNAETWEKLIAENKVGYMALLRNLRNILQARPKNIQKVYDKLQDKQAVLKSKQLPFRFLAAYREVQAIGTSKVIDVLENAIEHSVENLPKLKGKTVIAVDISGSMSFGMSRNSRMETSYIASLLASLASKICEEYTVYCFDTHLKKVTYSSRGGILQNALSIPFNGGGTDISLPLQGMLSKNEYADRLIMLSDNEINTGYAYRCQRLADEYRKKINPELWVHAVDLEGYGTQQFIGKRTNLIAGWNERIFDFVLLAEQGLGNQVKTIKEYKKF